MTRRQTLRAALTLTLTLALGSPVLAPRLAAQEVPPEALEHLRGILGTWECTWEFLGPDGEVVRTLRGTESARWAEEDRIVAMRTEIPSEGQFNESLLFYNTVDERIHLVSVDKRGFLWTLSGPPDGHVITSPPTEQPDGSLLEIRFHHRRIDADRLGATMEYRLEGQEEWTLSVRQTLVRTPG